MLMDEERVGPGAEQISIYAYRKDGSSKNFKSKRQKLILYSIRLLIFSQWRDWRIGVV